MTGLPAEALHRLYESERRVRELERQIGEARRILEGDPNASDPRPRLLRAEARRRDMALRLEQAEARERSERARARSHEARLYSGAIQSPKELSQLQAELEHLKGRLAVEEDQELELLGALEEAEREASSALTEASEARAALAEHENALAETRASAVRQRTEIPEAYIRLYDRVSSYRPPPPVVAVLNGLCTGCRIPLSMNQSRALRFAPDPVVCETCGRILLPG